MLAEVFLLPPFTYGTVIIKKSTSVLAEVALFKTQPDARVGVGWLMHVPVC